MKRLDRMLILAFLGPFLFCFSVVLFILVLQLLGLYADAFGGKGLGGGLFFRMVGLAMGRMLLEAMPLAVMAAAIMSFGRLGENRELTAIQASGISMLKFMRGLVGFGVLLTLVSIWLSFEVVPNASQKFYRLLSDIRRTKADLAIKPGIFYTDIDGFAIRVTEQHPETGTLYGVMLYDKRKMPEITVVVADSARMLPQSREDILRMNLYHGSRHQEFESNPSPARK
ncbi:MAG: LptF/LptG family permease, partial [Bacteroidota bacterium]